MSRFIVENSHILTRMGREMAEINGLGYPVQNSRARGQIFWILKARRSGGPGERPRHAPENEEPEGHSNLGVP